MTGRDARERSTSTHRPSRALSATASPTSTSSWPSAKVAYGAVSADGRTFAEQMYLREEIVPSLRALTDAVHAEGAAVSIQLGHCGAFTKNRELSTSRPRGPSRGGSTRRSSAA